MTICKPNALVLDGSEVKLRLMAERQESKTACHVDWVRFTTNLRNAEPLPVDRLFPLSTSIWDENLRTAQFDAILSQCPGGEFEASSQAYELAQKCCASLGSDFTVAAEIRKGHDFYKFRWSIERNGVECGWVGFLTSSDSPRQQTQSKTIHANLYGSACTYAAAGWRDRLADLVDSCKGTLTRCDLALDFFDGLPGGLDGIVDQFKAGLCDVNGRRLKTSCVGDWVNGKERSFYFGSKESGKQTNAYEKGHQLFGVGSGSDWLRVELRYGNKLRFLTSDMLRRPADFFGGASDWHQSMLLVADGLVSAESVPCEARLPLESVEAECFRNVKWMLNTAGPTMAAGIQHLSEGNLWDSLQGMALPGRLKKFSPSEIARGMASAFERITSIGGGGRAFA